MNIIQLPLFTDVYHEYSLPLEDDNFILTFLWQERTSSWYMDIRKDDLTPVVLGIRLVIDFPILADYKLKDFGLNGYFVLEDKGQYISNKLSTSPEALADNYQLFYLYPEE